MGIIEISSSAPQLEEIITEDGILCLILSFLNLKEAVRTSILSSRWRHIWTHLTKFKFNAITVLDAHSLQGLYLGGKEAYNLAKGKTDKFIRSVDSILQQLQGARVDEFTVGYFLDKSHAYHLDEWVRFAVRSKSKFLSIHLFRPYSTSLIERYEIPCQLLGSSTFIERFTLIFCSIKLPINFDGLSHVKELCICEVDITEEDFNHILSNCSFSLAKLAVLKAPKWNSIIISCPLSQLTHLLVQDCHRLRKIEVNAVNLRILIYQGVPVDFRFRQLSKLNNPDICFKAKGTMDNLDFYLIQLSSSLPHLRSLTFKTCGDPKVAKLPKHYSRFIHLMRLDWKWNVGVKMSLLHLTTFLDAAPILENFKLCFSAKSTDVVDEPPQTPTEMEMLPKHSHKYLKTIEVSEFYFATWQIDIVVYLLNVATALESMTLAINVATALESMTLAIGGEPSQEAQERGIGILNQVVSADVKLVIL